jgi:hypothetical protein
MGKGIKIINISYGTRWLDIDQLTAPSSLISKKEILVPITEDFGNVQSPSRANGEEKDPVSLTQETPIIWPMVSYFREILSLSYRKHQSSGLWSVALERSCFSHTGNTSHLAYGQSL